MVAQENPHSFFLLPTLYVFLQRVLKNCVEQQAGHRISLFRSFLDIENVALFVCLYRSLLVFVYLPQEAAVLVIDVARFKCLPNGIVRDGSRMPSVKSTVAVHILIPHSWQFCSFNLYVAR